MRAHQGETAATGETAGNFVDRHCEEAKPKTRLKPRALHSLCGY